MNVNVLDFGAVAGGEVLCTKAFNDAVKACHESGGGFVDIPAGVFKTGSIELLSNVYLRLSAGTEIIASEFMEDIRAPKRRCMWHSKYARENPGSECVALIFAENCFNVGVVGPGVINGRRGNTYNWEHNAGRIYLIVMAECKNVKITDVTLINSGFFVVYGIANENLMIDHVTIHSKSSLNGDGLDFDGGKDHVISNCILETGDDAIGLKTLSRDVPIENFLVTNCIFHSVWAGIRLGPETAADMKRITVSNCVFDGCNDGLKIQCCSDITFEDLMFTNLNMHNVVRPIFMTLNHYNFSAEDGSVRSPSGNLRRVLFNGIYARMSKLEGGGFYQSYNALTGMPDKYIEDVTFRDVHITADGGSDEVARDRIDVPELLDYQEFYPEAPSYIGQLPSANLYIKNAKNIKLYNCTFDCRKEDKRYAVVAEAVDKLKIRDTDAYRSGGLLRHVGCSDISVSDSTDGIWEVTGDMKKTWEDLRAEAVKIDKIMEGWAACVDKAIGGKCVEKIDIAENAEKVTFNVEKTEGDTVIYLPKVVGKFEAYVNGKPVAEMNISRTYWHMYSWAFEITDALADGSNTVEIVLKSAGEKGGLGVNAAGTGCNPYLCGFYSHAEIVKC